jgi:hypothetical protein
MSLPHLPRSFQVLVTCTRLSLCTFLTAILPSPAVSTPASAATELKIDKVTVEGGGVRFKLGTCSLDTSTTQSWQGMPSDETSSYFVCADLSSSLGTNFGYFVYSFIVQPKLPAGVKACQSPVEAYSTGSFGFLEEFVFVAREVDLYRGGTDALRTARKNYAISKVDLPGLNALS